MCLDKSSNLYNKYMYIVHLIQHAWNKYKAFILYYICSCIRVGIISKIASYYPKYKCNYNVP